MTDLQFAEEMLHQLQERHPRFHEMAYLFTLSALRAVMSSLDQPRHITGAELAEAVRDLAVERFGPMARTVLGHWGIHETQDLGDVVYALVDCGVLVTQSGDSRDDFADVFDFHQVFERDYPWGVHI